MSATVREYLDTERTQLIKNYGVDKAKDRRDASPDPSFQRDMYDFWLRYYEQLHQHSGRVVAGFSERDFKRALRGRPSHVPALAGENDVLKLLIKKIREALDNEDHPPTAERQLRTLRQLLRLEMNTNRKVLKYPFG